MGCWMRSPWTWFVLLIPTVRWNSPASLRWTEYGEPLFMLAMIALVAFLLRGFQARIREEAGFRRLAGTALGYALLARALTWFYFLNVETRTVTCGNAIDLAIGDVVKIGWLTNEINIEPSYQGLLGMLALTAFFVAFHWAALTFVLWLAGVPGRVRLAGRIAVYAAAPFVLLPLFVDGLGELAFWGACAADAVALAGLKLAGLLDAQSAADSCGKTRATLPSR